MKYKVTYSSYVESTISIYNENNNNDNGDCFELFYRFRDAKKSLNDYLITQINEYKQCLQELKKTKKQDII